MDKSKIAAYGSKYGMPLAFLDDPVLPWEVFFWTAR